PGRWPAAPRLAGLDRAGRLRHAERHVRPAAAGAPLVLAPVLQLADAVFDLLPSRLCHPRQLRDPAPGRPGLAWLRAAASDPRRDALRPGAEARDRRDPDRGVGRNPRRRGVQARAAAHAAGAGAISLGANCLAPAVPAPTGLRGAAIYRPGLLSTGVLLLLPVARPSRIAPGPARTPACGLGN